MLEVGAGIDERLLDFIVCCVRTRKGLGAFSIPSHRAIGYFELY